jgi:acetolactate synthase-1/2/3 large subunit
MNTNQTVRKKVTGSEAVILSMLAEGVDLIFGYPGGAIMPIYDALYDYLDQINHVLVRHEQGATHAADAYARISGKVGVCFATSGPGATNLITGIANAQVDSVPMVCITGQVNSTVLGFDAFQETDVVGVSMPITKWNFQVTKAEEIPAAIAKAFYIASTGRPGPVVVDITKDAQFQEFEFSYEKCTGLRSYKPYPKLRDDQVEEAAQLINGAKKPLLLVGHGVLIAKATDELREFVEKTGIPVASTLLGLSAFPNRHRLNVGFLGMHGNVAPNRMTNEADVIVAVGMRFDDRVTGNTSKYAPQAKIIHIEVDKSEIDKNIKSTVAINADAKSALLALTELVNANSHDAWLDEFRKIDAQEYAKIDAPLVNPPTDSAISMDEVITMISEKTKGEAIIVTDVGQHQMVAAKRYNFAIANSIVSSGGLGTMGFGIPAGLGAKLAAPDREVIVVVGDGGFQMTLQELGTICQNKAAVKILLLNNNFLGMVRQWQELFFDRRYSFTELHNPDFITITKGFGIAGEKVELRAELEAAVDRMLAQKNPYLLECVVGKEHNVFPMVPTGASVSEVRME